MVFVHDDLADYNRNTLYDNHLAWLIPELEEISGRDVAIIMLEKNRAPELTSFDYRNENEVAALRTWTDQISGLLYEASLTKPYDLNINKFLLLTRYNINNSVRGIATMTGHCGIAAITSYRNAAHEIGHMFGATHEDSEVAYDGWWNDTIMSTDNFSPFRGNVYRFSDKNKDNIRNHLNQFP